MHQGGAPPARDGGARLSITIEDRPPSVEELRSLAEAVGWTDHYDWDTVGQGLSRSLRGAVALDDGRAIGCARLVGDGGRYFYVQDVLVEPGHTDGGIATSMVGRLLDWARTTAPDEAVVGLFSSPEARGVYEGLGFRVPAAMTGMILEISGSPRELIEVLAEEGAEET